MRRNHWERISARRRRRRRRRRWALIWRAWHLRTPKRRRLANNSALTASLHSGQYPEFLRVHGPSKDLNPNDNGALDCLLLLWPASLCDLIADETDRYAYERGTAKWRNTSTAEIWTFLAISILMGIKILPSIKLYWSGDALHTLPRYMCKLSFWALLRNPHVIGGKLPAKGVSNKIKPVLDTQLYFPGVL